MSSGSKRRANPNGRSTPSSSPSTTPSPVVDGGQHKKPVPSHHNHQTAAAANSEANGSGKVDKNNKKNRTNDKPTLTDSSKMAVASSGWFTCSTILIPVLLSAILATGLYFSHASLHEVDISSNSIHASDDSTPSSNVINTEHDDDRQSNAIPPSKLNRLLDLSSKGRVQPQPVTDDLLKPSVFIGILVRNKAHALPYFLRGLEVQDYPKSHIRLTFIEDNSIDNSVDVLRQWAAALEGKYHSITVERGPVNDGLTRMWSLDHYRHLISLRQQLLDSARSSSADFYFSIDCDVVLMEPKTISHLVEVALSSSGQDDDTNASSRPVVVVAPMLNCTTSTYYSNFWGEMDENGYYKRSHNYFDILNRHIEGTFNVAMVHSAFLVNLRLKAARGLAYEPNLASYKGPIDDIIIFARSAQDEKADFYIDNSQFYGFLPSPVEDDDVYTISSSPDDWMQNWVHRDIEVFVHLRLQASIDLPGNDDDDHDAGSRVLPADSLAELARGQLPVRSSHGFDKIYYLNLDRRLDRKNRSEYAFDQLGIDAQHVSAVDGKQLTSQAIADMGVLQLQGYADPYHKRALKFGEIGCFMSHYYVWEEMVKHEYDRILILEDDVRFAPGFSRHIAEALWEADTYRPDWDLLYVGRKRMSRNERRVPQTRLLAYPDYTYWTLGYALTLSGARKLLDQRPLQKLVAVDEYLPIMFDRHPHKEWLDQFSPRNLIALSTEPLLVEPQRYIGEQSYVSDTEDSAVMGNF